MRLQLLAIFFIQTKSYKLYNAFMTLKYCHIHKNINLFYNKTYLHYFFNTSIRNNKRYFTYRSSTKRYHSYEPFYLMIRVDGGRNFLIMCKCLSELKGFNHGKRGEVYFADKSRLRQKRKRSKCRAISTNSLRKEVKKVTFIAL